MLVIPCYFADLPLQLFSLYFSRLNFFSVTFGGGGGDSGDYGALKLCTQKTHGARKHVGNRNKTTERISVICFALLCLNVIHPLSLCILF